MTRPHVHSAAAHRQARSDFSAKRRATIVGALVNLPLALIGVMKEAYDEVVRMGVPEEAAWAFFLGHIRTEMAIVFDIAGFPVSDGAKLAMEKGIDQLMRPDWKERVFDLEKIRHSVHEITDSVKV